MLGHWQMPPKWYRAASQLKDYRDPATTEREFPLVSFIRSRHSR